MNKDLFSLLQKKNTNKQENIENNDDTIVLLPQIPFYGLGGTINRIEETDNSYYKVLYNADGTINKNKIPVPKKKNKNKKYLLKDYYNDLEKYLEKNHSKYLEYENTNTLPVLTDKQFKILATVTSLATLSSLQFLFTTSTIGIILSTITSFSLYVVCDIHKKDKEKEKKHLNFIHQYKKHQRNLVDYKIDNPQKTKTTATKYTEIEKLDSDKLNEKVSAKLKQLKKEEI